MQTGVRLGIDVGSVRIGLAKSDYHGMLASPYETIQVAPDDELSLDSALSRVLQVVIEFSIIEIYVGLPLNLRGEYTQSTNMALSFARKISVLIPDISVQMVDERLTTVSAQSMLRQTGRTTKTSRRLIDQAAATIILEQALAFERSTHKAYGTPVREVLRESVENNE